MKRDILRVLRNFLCSVAVFHHDIVFSIGYDVAFSFYVIVPVVQISLHPSASLLVQSLETMAFCPLQWLPQLVLRAFQSG